MAAMMPYRGGTPGYLASIRQTNIDNAFNAWRVQQAAQGNPYAQPVAPNNNLPSTAASTFSSMVSPSSGGGVQPGSMIGPEAFAAAINGTLTPTQSAGLRQYYTPQLWNSFSGTDEWATSGGAGGMGGGGGGVGGTSLTGSSLNFDTLGKERLSAQNALDLSLLNQQGRQITLGQLLPLLKSAFGSFGGDGASLAGTQPTINAGPIYTPQQTAQQVNSQVARNDARFAGLLRSLQGRFGAAGVSPGSPAYAALAASLGAQNAASNADVETSLPFDVAGNNASHLLNSQVAQENQFSNRRQEQIASQRNAIAMLSSILGII
jgi:hypothetical protein